MTVPEQETDIYIPEDEINGAFDGDEVEVVVTKEPVGKNKEGKIVRIVSRGTARIVGLFQMKDKKQL